MLHKFSQIIIKMSKKKSIHLFLQWFHLLKSGLSTDSIDMIEVKMEKNKHSFYSLISSLGNDSFPSICIVY